jgi:hypothetical protein
MKYRRSAVAAAKVIAMKIEAKAKIWRNGENGGNQCGGINGVKRNEIMKAMGVTGYHQPMVMKIEKRRKLMAKAMAMYRRS